MFYKRVGNSVIFSTSWQKLLKKAPDRFNYYVSHFTIASFSLFLSQLPFV